MNKLQKKLALIIVLVLTATFLTGSIALAKVKIDFWHFGGLEWEKKWVEKKTEEFNNMQDEIEVDFTAQSWSGYRQKVISSSSMGTLADVFTLAGESAGEFAKAGIILPMEKEFEDFDEATSDIVPAAMKTGSYKGISYMPPLFVDADNVLVYSAEAFKKAGLDPDSPPQDWNELLEYAKKIKESTGMAGWGFDGKSAGTAHNFARVYVPVAGGRWVDEQKGKVMLDGPGAVNTLKWQLKVKEAGVLPKNFMSLVYMDYAKMLFAGKLAMFKGGTWIGGLAEDLGATEDFDWRIALFPEAPESIQGNYKPKRTFIGGFANVAINADTKKKQATWKFVKFLLSEKVMRGWAVNPGRIPVHKEVLNSDEFRQTKPDIYRMIENGLFDNAYKYASFPGMTQMNDIVVPLWQKTMSGKLDPEKAMKKAAEQSQKVYDELK